MTYLSHVTLPAVARHSEVRRARCACGLVRRVTLTASGGYVSEDSDDGQTWRAPRYGADCARRVTPDD